MSSQAEVISQDQLDARQQGGKIKCLVWDLDHTLWNGVLLENSDVHLRDQVISVMEELDARGILQSIASKNDYDHAMDKLKEYGIDHFFIYPQINWNRKSLSIQQIAESINIGIDSLAFIDDQPFEREEVAHTHPSVLCLDAEELLQILDYPAFKPRFVTEDSKLRRVLYQTDLERKKVEEEYVGPQADFLASLQMKVRIGRVQPGDLQRAEELTVRTHQLNTTGYTYSYEELDELRQSDSHLLLIASLDDKYGTYGKIGLTLLECREEVWTIKLLLLSCRVMSRGIGGILINQLLRMAKESQVRLRAEFLPNSRNRMMYITYKFAGFQEVQKQGNLVILEHDLTLIPAAPEYVDVEVSL